MLLQIIKMKVLRTVKDLKEFVLALKNEGKTIGLVPTMGALHAGHISLVERAVKDDQSTIVSVFVNPTQFNNPNDLATYPRNEQADFDLLESAGVTAAFAPSVEEIYPPEEADKEIHVFDLGNVAEVMEGKFRPGHFQGVAQIVSKLFRMVEPTHAYFGEKDFQQIAVIRAMVNQLNIPVKINACPILREADGLALSSRNVRLTPEQRQKAPLIARTLKESTNFAPEKSVQEVIDYVVNTINADPVMRVEYYEIVDGNTMESIQSWSDTTYPVGCITVYCGEVRLIDNIKY